MFSITSNSKEFMRDLHRIPKAMQEVTAATLTQTAQAVTKRSERNLGRTMIVRTSFTPRSLKTYKASPGRPIDRQDSVAGTISDYLPIQDQGGKIKARRRVLAVPTNRVRGSDRKRRVTQKYRLDSMPRAFVLRPSSPTKILKRPALFIRTGKKGKLEKVRDLGARDYTLKARLWHTEAVNKYGNWEYMAQVFRREAMRRIRGAS